MIYRPHFAYPPAPPGARDEAYEYFFDTSNIQRVTLVAGATQFAMLLQLDKDAEYRWRGFKIGLPNTNEGVSILWKDGLGNVLADGTLNLALYSKNAGYAVPFSGGYPVV